MGRVIGGQTQGSKVVADTYDLALMYMFCILSCEMQGIAWEDLHCFGSHMLTLNLPNPFNIFTLIIQISHDLKSQNLTALTLSCNFDGSEVELSRAWSN